MKFNVRSWSKPMLFSVVLIALHTFIIFYSLYESFFGFDLYPALGLLTYSLLSIGMHLSVLLLIINRFQYANLFFVLSIVTSVFIFSDIYFPGILLTSWRYSSAVAVSICCLSLLNSVNNKKHALDKVLFWLIVGMWLTLTSTLLFALSSPFIYSTILILLIVCSCMLITLSLIRRKLPTR